ncbi:MAG: DUF5694 domain-containing protein [Planctomycetota bacterium]|jgi:hypothetical protein
MACLRCLLLGTLLALAPIDPLTVNGAGAAQDWLRAPIPATARTQVMVLATGHLSALGDSFDPRMVESLLEVLEAYRPDLIAVESLPPVEIRRLQAEAAPDGGAAKILAAFARDAVRGAALAQSSMTEPPPPAPAAEEGARAAAHRHAAWKHLLDLDVPSALLQWSYVAREERVAGDVVTDELADFLNRKLERPNEIISIGVALAGRLGHETLASVDDHVDDEIGLDTGLNAQLMEELSNTTQFAELMESGYLQAAGRQLADHAATGDLLPLYRRWNAESFQADDISKQWHIFYRTNLPSRLDRARAALWESRNLNIAARIRAASVKAAGGRVLVVIGASHKAFLDRYLGALMDVEVVQLEQLLEDD